MARQSNCARQCITSIAYFIFFFNSFGLLSLLFLTLIWSHNLLTYTKKYEGERLVHFENCFSNFVFANVTIGLIYLI